ncbi:MAG: glycosyltransferase family 39 protein, partial [Gemmataceae bacterium]
MDSPFTVPTRFPNPNNIGFSSDVRKANSTARWRILAAGVLAATAVLFLARLGSHGVVSEELRWAEVAREMRRTGDYVHPAINGRAYFDKPVGSYWLIVAVSYLTGGVTEATARLPAAVAGWVGGWLVMRLARRGCGPAAGVLAGAVLATAFGFAFYARRATADVETVTGVLAAVCLFEWNRTRPPGWWVVGLWAVMVVTSQRKVLPGFALPLAVFSAFGTWSGWASGGGRGIISGNRWLFNRWTLFAAPLGGG